MSAALARPLGPRPDFAPPRQPAMFARPAGLRPGPWYVVGEIWPDDTDGLVIYELALAPGGEVLLLAEPAAVQWLTGVAP